PGLCVVGVDGALCGPEPQRLALRLGERLVQTSGEDAHAQLGGGVDRAVRVCEVRFALARLDDALSLNVHRDELDAVAVRDRLEFSAPFGREVGGANVAVGDLD